nr:hypothetical protein [Caldilineaceae bacterium]
MIVNARVIDQLAALSVGATSLSDYSCGLAIASLVLSSVGLVMAFAGLAVLSGGTFALVLAAGGYSLSAAALAVSIAGVADSCKQCKPGVGAGGAGNGRLTGMGSTFPQGGPSCGGSSGGGGGGGNPFPQAAGLHANPAGRYQIRIFARSGGGPPLSPFTGVTDAAGYFYIPAMPQNEPFRAVAIDMVTGLARTFDGVGPPIGQSAVMYFNFPPGDTPQNLYTIQIGDTISDGVPGPGAGNLEELGVQDLYTFSAAPGQQVYFDNVASHLSPFAAGWLLKDSQGTVLFTSCTGCADPGVRTLTQGGTYTLVVNPTQEATVGSYVLKLWPAPAPQQFAIAVGDTISDGVPGPGAGNLETVAAQDLYTFS